MWMALESKIIPKMVWRGDYKAYTLVVPDLITKGSGYAT